MLQRRAGYLVPRTESVPAASAQLQREGYAVLPQIFDAAARATLAAEIEEVYATLPPDNRSTTARAPEIDQEFRYEMFNRSAACQRAVGHSGILAVIEPLLGEDCHIIANTCWRNPPGTHESHGGGFWHIDAGPHIPRRPSEPWPDYLPYPIFAIGAHLFLQDCPLPCGPTGVIPRSHLSGQPPPRSQLDDVNLSYRGRASVPLTARAGDVALFVSDVWHRRLPTSTGDAGRFFLQVHYARRDIAQRLHTTDRTNQLAPEALARIASEREAQLLGLHPPRFYDG